MESEPLTLEQLLEKSRADLDELAEQAGIENPKRLKTKAELAHLILAATGVGPAPTFTLRLADGFNGFQVHVGGSEVELDADSPTFTTTDARLHAELCELDALEAVDA